MFKLFACLMVILSISIFSFVFPGCSPGPGPIDNDTENLTPTPIPTPTPGQGATPTPTPGGNNNTNLNVIKTNISVHYQARIAAGDDIIVYGTGAINGVAWIKPSAGDTTGQSIPDGATFSSKAFAVAGKKIALVRNYEVYIYNTEDNTLSHVNPDNVTLAPPLPLGVYAIGHIQGDGNYFGVLTDSDAVQEDSTYFKVIDVSGATPKVINFSGDLPVNYLWHITVDGANKQVAVANGGSMWVYDITQPTLDPIAYNAGNTGDMQFTLRNNNIVYASNNWGVAVDVGTGVNVDLDVPLREVSSAINNGKFSFFMDNESIGSNYRAAIGTTENPADWVAADKGVKVNGSNGDNGYVGYGQTTAITPNGSKIFIAGWESIGAGEYLQVSTGGDFGLVEDADGDTWGFPASDVSASANTVAFKGGTGQTTKVSYIRLQ